MKLSSLASRILLVPSLFVLIACAPPPPVGTWVAVGTSAATLHSGQTATITATVTHQTGGMPAPAPALPSTVKFTASIGSVSPAARASNLQGEATTTYTAPVVDQDTSATVEAKYGSTTGTVPLTIKPAIGTGNFSSTANDNVTVTPSVTQLPNGSWKFVYVVQDGTVSSQLRTIFVSFQKQVSLATSKGTVIPPAQSLHFAITAPVPSQGMVGPITITVTGDIEPGGTASWDIIDTDIKHAFLTTTGPKQ